MTTDYLILFTTKGNFLYIPVNEIKEAKWNDEGFHISSLINVIPDDKIVGGFAVRKFRDDLFIVMLTKNGYIKRCRLSSFEVIRKSKAIPAIRLAKGDELIDVCFTSGQSNIFIASKEGKAIFYNENDIGITNPKTSGNKAGSFRGKELAGLLSYDPEEKLGKVMLVTDRCHTRIFDMNKIPLAHRLDKVFTLYDMFKKEPHSLIFIQKVVDIELPYTLDAVLNDYSRYDVTFEDLYLTPMEKYAKRPDEFPSKNRILRISREFSPLLDETIKSYEPTHQEEEAQNETSVENKPESTGAFEQISLFDDLNDE